MVEIVVEVDPVPHACCAWVRSAASFCWSVLVVASSWVRVFWSWVIVLCVPAEVPLPLFDGVVVVVVVDVDEATPSSRWRTGGLAGLVLYQLRLVGVEGRLRRGHRLAQRGRVERPQGLAGGDLLAHRRGDCGDLSCRPGMQAEASLTGSTVPTTVKLVPMSARVTVAMRYPELPLLDAANAAAPPPRRIDQHDGPRDDGTPVTGPAPARTGRIRHCHRREHPRRIRRPPRTRRRRTRTCRSRRRSR